MRIGVHPNKGTKHDIEILVSIFSASILSASTPPENRALGATEFQEIVFTGCFAKTARRATKDVRKSSIADRAYWAVHKLGKVGFGNQPAFEQRFATV